MTTVHRGDVWWADVPGDKRRPVVVLTRERFITRLNSVIVAPITTNVRCIPTEVALDSTDGLPQVCAANFDNVFTLRRELLVERIAHLPPDKFDLICRACRFAVGC